MNTSGSRRPEAPLEGRTVIVTGGNGGIGFGLAEAVHAAGACVAVWGRNPEKNQSAVDRLDASGGSAIACVVDVTDVAQVDEAMRQTLNRFDRIDACFANAAIAGDAVPFLDQGLDDWHHVLVRNVSAAFVTLQRAARQMVTQGDGGALVTVSSIATAYGAPTHEPYAASKAATTSLAMSLAVGFAANGIRSNVLRPGWTDTEMTASDGAFGSDDHDRFTAATIRRTPSRRWGTPADMGAAAVFLADPSLTFHTGDVITVDGGYSVA